MKNVLISDVTTADTAELLQIYAPYVTDTAISFEYDVPNESEFRSRIEQISAKYPYIKATVDGQIVGYAYASTFKGRRAYDYSAETTIYLKKDCRGMGIGKILYTELENRLKLRGILNMNACIAVPSSDDEYLTDDSIKFHHKMGFTDVGVFHKCGYKFGKWYDMMWAEKLIGEHK